MQSGLKQLICSLALISPLVLTSCARSQTENHQPGLSSVDMIRISQVPSLNWVSVADIAKELKGKPPMAVGFDVDDTVLFSSPGFYHGQQVFSPGGYSYLKNQKFWNDLNCHWDAFSMPKEIAKKLIAMHQKRGDDIYFITARTYSKCEITTQYLKKIFHIKHMNPVIFTGSKKGVLTKVPYIKAHDIKIYYGDSDSDILAARKAGAEGIRIIRAANSSYKPVPKNGDLGEQVVRDSQY
ncbi:MAG: Class B acid phosphatase [Candidatus Celerinatantimonas neptuna]|nr:MAG: Class B acid phosphatase [Candidatus Celerinatantimonas neptuna]